MGFCMADMVGTVVLLQVQRSALTTPTTYDPNPVLEVDQLAVAARGVLGGVNGGWVVDVHSSAHPDGSGRRPLSIGFTSHYEHMRSRFDAVPDGIAGENILVAADRMFSEAELAGGLIVRSSERPDVVLRAPKVARPCRQFSRFLLGGSDDREAISSARSFLEAGVRGFICGTDHIEGHAIIKVGDEVWLADL